MVYITQFRQFWSWCVIAGWVFQLATSVFSQALTTPLIDLSAPVSIPFEDGERVRYEVNWRPLHFLPSVRAGQIDVWIRKQEYLGTPAYRITAQARSDTYLAAMGWEIEDELESIVDARDFRSLRFVHRKRSSTRKKDLEFIVDYQANEAQVRENDLAEDRGQTVLSKKIEELPGEISDILSVFYAGRLRELRPPQKYLIYLFDNGQIKQVKVQVEALETTHSSFDSHDSVRLRTENGIFRGAGHFLIWYSRDALRLPVRFEAFAKLGTVSGQLVLIETPRCS